MEKDKKLPIKPAEIYKLQDFVIIEVNLNNKKYLYILSMPQKVIDNVYFFC